MSFFWGGSNPLAALSPFGSSSSGATKREEDIPLGLGSKSCSANTAATAAERLSPSERSTSNSSAAPAAAEEKDIALTGQQPRQWRELDEVSSPAASVSRSSDCCGSLCNSSTSFRSAYAVNCRYRREDVSESVFAAGAPAGPSSAADRSMCSLPLSALSTSKERDVRLGAIREHQKQQQRLQQTSHQPLLQWHQRLSFLRPNSAASLAEDSADAAAAFLCCISPSSSRTAVAEADSAASALILHDKKSGVSAAVSEELQPLPHSSRSAADVVVAAAEAPRFPSLSPLGGVHGSSCSSSICDSSARSRHSAVVGASVHTEEQAADRESDTLLTGSRESRRRPLSETAGAESLAASGGALVISAAAVPMSHAAETPTTPPLRKKAGEGKSGPSLCLHNVLAVETPKTTAAAAVARAAPQFHSVRLNSVAKEDRSTAATAAAASEQKSLGAEESVDAVSGAPVRSTPTASASQKAAAAGVVGTRGGGAGKSARSVTGGAARSVDSEPLEDYELVSSHSTCSPRSSGTQESWQQQPPLSQTGHCMHAAKIAQSRASPTPAASAKSRAAAAAPAVDNLQSQQQPTQHAGGRRLRQPLLTLGTAPCESLLQQRQQQRRQLQHQQSLGQDSEPGGSASSAFLMGGEQFAVAHAPAASSSTELRRTDWSEEPQPETESHPHPQQEQEPVRRRLRKAAGEAGSAEGSCSAGVVGRSDAVGAQTGAREAETEGAGVAADASAATAAGDADSFSAAFLTRHLSSNSVVNRSNRLKLLHRLLGMNSSGGERGERKWRSMEDRNLLHFMQLHRHTFFRRLRRGVPASHRWNAWRAVCLPPSDRRCKCRPAECGPLVASSGGSAAASLEAEEAAAAHVGVEETVASVLLPKNQTESSFSTTHSRSSSSSRSLASKLQQQPRSSLKGGSGAGTSSSSNTGSAFGTQQQQQAALPMSCTASPAAGGVGGGAFGRSKWATTTTTATAAASSIGTATTIATTNTGTAAAAAPPGFTPSTTTTAASAANASASAFLGETGSSSSSSCCGSEEWLSVGGGGCRKAVQQPQKTREEKGQQQVQLLHQQWPVGGRVSAGQNQLELQEQLAQLQSVGERSCTLRDCCGAGTDCRRVYEREAARPSMFLALISIDAPRTFPDVEVFDRGAQLLLCRTLNAFANIHPEVGYCQGMNFIAGLLLLVSAFDEFEAFCVFRVLMQRYRLKGFFQEKFPLLRKYMKAFDSLAAVQLPELRAHFVEEGVLPAVYLHQWFLTLFVTSLPLRSVCVLWDFLLGEGLHALLQLAVALLKVLTRFIIRLRFEEVVKFLKSLKSSGGGCDDFKVGKMLVKQAAKVQLPEAVLTELLTADMGLLLREAEEEEAAEVQCRAAAAAAAAAVVAAEAEEAKGKAQNPLLSTLAEEGGAEEDEEEEEERLEEGTATTAAKAGGGVCGSNNHKSSAAAAAAGEVEVEDEHKTAAAGESVCRFLPPPTSSLHPENSYAEQAQKKKAHGRGGGAVQELLVLEHHHQVREEEEEEAASLLQPQRRRGCCNQEQAAQSTAAAATSGEESAAEERQQQQQTTRKTTESEMVVFRRRSLQRSRSGRRRSSSSQRSIPSDSWWVCSETAAEQHGATSSSSRRLLLFDLQAPDLPQSPSSSPRKSAFLQRRLQQQQEPTKKQQQSSAAEARQTSCRLELLPDFASCASSVSWEQRQPLTDKFSAAADFPSQSFSFASLKSAGSLLPAAARVSSELQQHLVRETGSPSAERHLLGKKPETTKQTAASAAAAHSLAPRAASADNTSLKKTREETSFYSYESFRRAAAATPAPPPPTASAQKSSAAVVVVAVGARFPVAASAAAAGNRAASSCAEATAANAAPKKVELSTSETERMLLASRQQCVKDFFSSAASSSSRHHSFSVEEAEAASDDAVFRARKVAAQSTGNSVGQFPAATSEAAAVTSPSKVCGITERPHSDKKNSGADSWKKAASRTVSNDGAAAAEGVGLATLAAVASDSPSFNNLRAESGISLPASTSSSSPTCAQVSDNCCCCENAHRAAFFSGNQKGEDLAVPASLSTISGKADAPRNSATTAETTETAVESAVVDYLEAGVSSKQRLEEERSGADEAAAEESTAQQAENTLESLRTKGAESDFSAAREGAASAVPTAEEEAGLANASDSPSGCGKQRLHPQQKKAKQQQRDRQQHHSRKLHHKHRHKQQPHELQQLLCEEQQRVHQQAPREQAEQRLNCWLDEKMQRQQQQLCLGTFSAPFNSAEAERASSEKGGHAVDSSVALQQHTSGAADEEKLEVAVHEEEETNKAIALEDLPREAPGDSEAAAPAATKSTSESAALSGDTSEFVRAGNVSFALYERIGRRHHRRSSSLVQQLRQLRKEQLKNPNTDSSVPEMLYSCKSTSCGREEAAGARGLAAAVITPDKKNGKKANEKQSEEAAADGECMRDDRRPECAAAARAAHLDGKAFLAKPPQHVMSAFASVSPADGACKTPNETLNETPNETLKETPNETLKETPNETLNETLPANATISQQQQKQRQHTQSCQKQRQQPQERPQQPQQVNDNQKKQICIVVGDDQEEAEEKHREKEHCESGKTESQHSQEEAADGEHSENQEKLPNITSQVNTDAGSTEQDMKQFVALSAAAAAIVEREEERRSLEEEDGFVGCDLLTGREKEEAMAEMLGYPYRRSQSGSSLPVRSNFSNSGRTARLDRRRLFISAAASPSASFSSSFSAAECGTACIADALATSLPFMFPRCTTPGHRPHGRDLEKHQKQQRQQPLGCDAVAAVGPFTGESADEVAHKAATAEWQRTSGASRKVQTLQYHNKDISNCRRRNSSAHTCAWKEQPQQQQHQLRLSASDSISSRRTSRSRDASRDTEKKGRSSGPSRSNSSSTSSSSTSNSSTSSSSTSSSSSSSSTGTGRNNSSNGRSSSAGAGSSGGSSSGLASLVTRLLFSFAK